MGSTLTGHVAVFIKMPPGLVQAPGIQQSIGRAGIEADDRLSRSGGQPGDIGNATEIQNASILGG